MRILFACGGTAGHINPAIAIAKGIKSEKPDCDILFVGAKGGMEGKLVSKEGFKIEFINVKGFIRKLSLDTAKAIIELGKGLEQSRRIIKKFNPDYVVGTGGYVCGPVLFNACLKKIPTLVHEQNVFPGITVRILSRCVDIVALSFEESVKYLPKGKSLVLTGNPIRKEIISSDYKLSRSKLGIDNRPFILAFGGSLGAEKLNETIIEYVINLCKNKEENTIHIMFGTGDRYYDYVKQELFNRGINIKKLKNMRIIPYIFNMADAIAASDIVISRAGAITVSEITACGKAAILIPSPNVTNNHQEFNAEALRKRGAALVIKENDLNGEVLYNKIKNLLNEKSRLKDMSMNSLKLGKVDATEKIVDLILKNNPLN